MPSTRRGWTATRGSIWTTRSTTGQRAERVLPYRLQSALMADVTTAAKDRLTVIDVLTNHRPRRFLVNAEALDFVEAFGLSAVRRRQLGQLPAGTLVDEVMMHALLEEHLPGLGPQQRKWILDATAVAAYQAAVEFPVVRLLVCEDVPQFATVMEELAL